MANTADKASPKKPKLVRDSFTIPKNEFTAIETLKTRAIALGTSVKKSELLRAGLMALQGLGDAAYKAAIAAVPTLKTGRPANAKPAKPAPARKKAAAPVKKAKPVAKASTKAAPKAPAKAPAKAPEKASTKAPAKAARQAPAKKAPARKPAAKPAAKPAVKAAA